MPAVSADGQEVGWVAAVVLDDAGQSTAVLLARPPMTLEYYVLQVVLVGSMVDGCLRLSVSARATEGLPRRSAG